MTVTKVCVQCNSEFSIPLRRSESVRFCSWGCRKAHNNTDKVCQQCGETFSVPNSVLRKGGGKFCGKKCKDLARTDQTAKNSRHRERRVFVPLLVTCETCNSEFRIPPARKATARFCSNKCKFANQGYTASYKHKVSGELSPRWAGGKYPTGGGYKHVTVRGHPFATANNTLFVHRVVLEEWLREECPDHPFLVEVDGVKYLDPKIETHHRDLVRENNDRGNLLAVTRAAHFRIHNGGDPPEQWECWPDY